MAAQFQPSRRLRSTPLQQPTEAGCHLLLHQRQQLAAAAELHDQVDPLTVLEELQELHNVGVLQPHVHLQGAQTLHLHPDALQSGSLNIVSRDCTSTSLTSLACMSGS